jgi:hypothetical protein
MWRPFLETQIYPAPHLTLHFRHLEARQQRDLRMQMQVGIHHWLVGGSRTATHLKMYLTHTMLGQLILKGKGCGVLLTESVPHGVPPPQFIW